VKPLLLLRSGVVTLLLFPFLTVFSSLMVLVLVALKLRGENRIIQFWASSICRLYGVKVKVFYPDRIKPGGFLLLFNHASFFDIFAISSVLPEVRFGAKIELFKIPFFGSAMRSVGVIPISRDQRERSVQELRNNQHRISSGVRVALSPEGGRLGGEDFLAPFKSGPFHFAIGSGAPIQPVLVQGASLVWPKGSLTPGARGWRSEIELVFLPQISTEDYNFEQRNQLKDIVYQIMESALIDWRDKKKNPYSSFSRSSSSS